MSLFDPQKKEKQTKNTKILYLLKKKTYVIFVVDFFFIETISSYIFFKKI